ncbi:MAG TPA: tetratricopeptide repeat-containing glycosyltransferase family protein [Aliidongia sp.]|nr:tetratricopeptide repeat-containing glycosyltransferase family protein [Aliidongia sp.]
MAELVAAPSPPVSKTVDQWLADAGAHEQAGRFVEAELLMAQIIAAKPNYHPALNQAAIVSFKRKRTPEAIERLARAIALAPEVMIYHRNICELYRTQNRLDEAMAHALRAVELAPEDAGAHYNLSVVRYDRLEIAEAITAVRRSLALDPSNASAHFELAECLLADGQFEEGWREYEWRFDLPGVPKPLPSVHRGPLWDGRPIPDGKLLLIGDQGFGDTIQFCRYLPMVAERCPQIVMGCSPEMRQIVGQQPGITEYFDHWDHISAFEAYCPLSGLPRLFGTDLATIPARVPYVRADAAKAKQWRQRLDTLVPRGFRRIGLVWAGRPTHGNDHNRSMRLKALGPLCRIADVAFLSLQKGPAVAEIGSYFGAAPLINLGAEIEDYSDTAAILDSIERVVTVDTSVAHLGGAMGRPVSILVPYAPDWRWLLGRSDSPWYPSVTLYRQARPGDWTGPVEAVARSLAR